MQCDAVCCSVVPCIAGSEYGFRVQVPNYMQQCHLVCCSVLQCVAVVCSVLQCVASLGLGFKVQVPHHMQQYHLVSCILLQCVAVYCSYKQECHLKPATHILIFFAPSRHPSSFFPTIPLAIFPPSLPPSLLPAIYPSFLPAIPPSFISLFSLHSLPPCSFACLPLSLSLALPLLPPPLSRRGHLHRGL